MIRYLLSFIIFSLFCLNFGQKNLSPLCYQSSKNLEIYSTVLIHKQIYFFTAGDLITVVNVKNNTIEKVENIYKLLNFSSFGKDFKTPVKMAFTHTNENKEKMLTLVDNDYIDWNFTLKGMTFVGKNNTFGKYENQFKYFQVIENRSKKSWFLMGFTKDSTGDWVVLYETKTIFPNFKHQIKRYLNKKGNNEIGFIVIQKEDSAVNKLNGKKITSAVLIHGKIRLFGGKYSCDVSPTVDNFTKFKVKDYTESVCKQTTVTTKQTTVPTKKTTVPSKTTIITTQRTTVPSKTTIITTQRSTVPSKTTTTPTTVPTNETTLLTTTTSTYSSFTFMSEANITTYSTTDSLESTTEETGIDNKWIIISIFGGLGLLIVIIVCIIVLVLMFSTKKPNKVFIIKKKEKPKRKTPVKGKQKLKSGVQDVESKSSEFEVVPNIDYSKPIPLEDPENGSETSLNDRPTDLKMKKK